MTTMAPNSASATGVRTDQIHAALPTISSTHHPGRSVANLAHMGFGVAVAVPDGVAVATDSRVVAEVSGGPPAIMSDTQQKIVPLSSHVVVLTIDPYLISGQVIVNTRAVLEQIVPDMPPNAKLEEVMSELPGRFAAAAGHSREELSEITLRVVGYNEDERSVSVVLLNGLASTPELMHSTSNPGLDWFGYIDIATRLVKGNTSVDVPDTEKGPEVELFIPTALMSLDDALDLAETLVNTSATFARVVRGLSVPGSGLQPFQIPVGGPVQSAVVRADGIRWVKQPRWAVGS